MSNHEMKKYNVPRKLTPNFVLDHLIESTKYEKKTMKINFQQIKYRSILKKKNINQIKGYKRKGSN
jgi:hypothetical protein